MKKLLQITGGLRVLLLSVLFCFVSFNSTGQNYEWAKSIGGTSLDYGKGLYVDVFGNLYVTGSFRNTVDFDPGVGIAILVSTGLEDIFFAKYDASGNYLWAKNIGGSGIDNCNDITIDASGNIYLTGSFGDTADFDPGPSTAFLISAGVSDIFIAKYDTSGNYLWAINMGGSLGDNGISLSLGDSGNVYVTGNFRGAADFDPEPNDTALLISTGIQSNAFIAKYDTSGFYLWAISIGGSSGDNGYSLSLDNSGNVYVTGYFADTVDFDPGPDTALLISAGIQSDVFIAKYNTSGDYLWAKNIGGISVDNGFSLSLGDSGNVYVTGNFSDTVDFDPGLDTANLTSAGASDIFIAKYNASGDYLWAKNMGGAFSDFSYNLHLDASGNIYITGSFSDTADFNPDTDTANLISAGSSDIFIAKYDPSGFYLWAKNIGGDNLDIGNGLSIDPLYNVYVTGLFWSTADFNPEPDTANLISAGASDVFIAKYSQCLPPAITVLVTDSIIKCEGDSVSFIVTATGGAVPLNYQWKKDGTDIAGATDTIFTISSVTSDTAGSYTFIVTNVCGTDTSNIMTLIVNLTYNTPVSDSICQGDSIKLPGGLWVTSAGIYYDTLISVAGCDSVITTVLTVISLPTAGITGATAICNGDSTVLTATGGSIYIWNTGDTSASISVNTLTDTTYYVIVSNPGCNSTDSVQVTITVNPLPEIIASADTISILLGEEVNLSVSGGVSYNWTPDITTPVKTTLYYVYGTDSNGCTNVDSVFIIVSEDFRIEVPDIFSPNGDGYNDILYVSGKGIQWIVFRIFDRWGDKVFESNDINFGWNGIYNARPMNPAAFAYYLEAGFTNGKKITKQGGVALIR